MQAVDKASHLKYSSHSKSHLFKPGLHGQLHIELHAEKYTNISTETKTWIFPISGKLSTWSNSAGFVVWTTRERHTKWL